MSHKLDVCDGGLEVFHFWKCFIWKAKQKRIPKNSLEVVESTTFRETVRSTT